MPFDFVYPDQNPDVSPVDPRSVELKIKIGEGRVLVPGSNGKETLYDVATGTVIKEKVLINGADFMNEASFSNVGFGNRFYGYDTGNSLTLCDLNSGKILLKFASPRQKVRYGHSKVAFFLAMEVEVI
jgi:hypothetical protein